MTDESQAREKILTTIKPTLQKLVASCAVFYPLLVSNWKCVTGFNDLNELYFGEKLL